LQDTAICFGQNGNIMKSPLITEEITTTWVLDQLKLPHLTHEIESYMLFHRQHHGF
jgi:hypothetical protein